MFGGKTLRRSLLSSDLFSMETLVRPPAWKMVLAFSIIYFVWGSTFLAIRVGVRAVPPLVFAAMRFFIAGVLLYLWLLLKGTRSPTRRQWVSASILALCIFVFDYGLLFWAEQRVPSGIAAVMLATIPVFMALSEIIFLRTQRLTLRLALALLVGIGGVAVLVSRSLSLGEVPIDHAGALALVIAAMSWSVASALTRKLDLPESKAMSAAAQMVAGGFFLTVTAAIFGEFRGFHVQAVPRGVWFALAYLILAGSIVGFTAYVWLIHHESPTKVGTYAYVNPVVAVVIGYFFGGETVGPRTLTGTLLVLVSVIVITTTRVRKPTAAPMMKPLSEVVER
jgi:drug/metabolite transporter (DMT)-like permease